MMILETQVDLCQISSPVMCSCYAVSCASFLVLPLILQDPVGAKRENSRDLHEDTVSQSCYCDCLETNLLLICLTQNSPCFCILMRRKPHGEHIEDILIMYRHWENWLLWYSVSLSIKWHHHQGSLWHTNSPLTTLLSKDGRINSSLYGAISGYFIFLLFVSFAWICQVFMSFLRLQ